eukprot:SAG31_NODE_5127_length_2725_cov_1.449353_2_plen_102_part_00
MRRSTCAATFARTFLDLKLEVLTLMDVDDICARKLVVRLAHIGFLVHGLGKTATASRETAGISSASVMSGKAKRQACVATVAANDLATFAADRRHAKLGTN